jgi:glutamyl-tRNA synthetase
VIDDIEMGITHVIRGEDHLANTAKHIALFNALGAKPPQYAHIPLILNPDGSKMSKRDQGAVMTAYMDEGYAPEAVVNYLMLLGWSAKANREVLSIPEAVSLFDLPQILRHNARFDLTKLHWLNGEYIRQMSTERFAELLKPALKKAGIDAGQFSQEYLHATIGTCREKIKLFSEMPSYAGFYYQEQFPMDSESVKTHFIAANKPRITRLREALSQLEPFNSDNIQSTLKGIATEFGVKPAVLVHPLRIACTGKGIGPSLYHLMEILGKTRVLQRIDKALGTDWP